MADTEASLHFQENPLMMEPSVSVISENVRKTSADDIHINEMVQAVFFLMRDTQGPLHGLSFTQHYSGSSGQNKRKK